MEAVRETVAQNFGGASRIARDENNFTLDQVPSQDGKVAIITGGSEGIGFACLYTLLSKGAKKVYVLSVDEKIIDDARQALVSELGQSVVERMEWKQCDMADFARVSKVAGEIAHDTDRIDILINNAGRGVMTAQITDYGVDRHMAVNHIGHVILTSHLLPLLKKTAQDGSTVRIVNQASNAHQAAPKDTKFETIEEINTDVGPNGQYGRSKLANILYARYLARHITSKDKNVLINATHPGVVSTEMSTRDVHEPYPWAGYIMSKGLEPIKKDKFEGSLSAVYAATTTTNSGEYICPPAKPESGNELAQNEALGEALMKLTRDIIMEKTQAQSQGCPVDDIVQHI